jgi:hypothetical protein
MNAPNGNTAPKGLRGWWASPPRSGMQRIIVPFEYRHLRFWAGVRTAIGVSLVGLGAVTLVAGSFTTEAVGWATLWLAAAAAQFAVAYWFLTITRSRSA